MAREVVEINNEYGRAAAELGQEAYLASLAQEQIEKHEYNIEKLKNKMRSLAKEAHALSEKKEPELEEPKGESSEQK